MREKFFDKLAWEQDRMLLDDLVFRLNHYRNEDTWELGDECFLFVKIKQLVDQYERFWLARPDFSPRNVFELGLADGGSLVFWYECFQPNKHVGVDIVPRDNSPYLQGYLQLNQLEDKLRTYWGVDQTDASTLRQIVAKEFAGPLDLIIDDASHMYAETKSSFETLFPMLRQGGLYIIEDWAWEHWKDFQRADHPWHAKKSLTPLICELIEATGSSTALIANVQIFQGFAVIERGPMKILPCEHFSLDNHISRRTTRPKSNTIFDVICKRFSLTQ